VKNKHDIRPILVILAILAMVAWFATGCSCGSGDKATGAKGPKVLVVAFDGLDPELVTDWMDSGYLPTFSKLAKQGAFSNLGTSIPPQSPVAWSNFITGQNPGGHGIFDFIHRNPDTYLPFLSTSKTEAPEKIWKLLGYQIPLDKASVKLLRDGKAFWEYLGEAGIPTTVFSCPSNFPPVEGNFRSLAGMGTPDLLGGYGMFSFFTDQPDRFEADGKEVTGGKIYPVDVIDGKARARIIGPKNSFLDVEKGTPVPDTTVPFTVYVDKETGGAVVEIQDQKIVLAAGDWSDWTTLEFEMAPMIAAKGMVRFKLKAVDPYFGLYVSAINIDPRDPAMPISTPPEYAAELADAINGPFHTQGIPEDTKALSAGVLTNAEFIEQGQAVFKERMAMYDHELARFEAEGGFLFFYFSSSDQMSHMFWRTMDTLHPAFDAEKDTGYENVLRDVYIEMDGALAKALEKVDDQTLLLVMSDHGFAPYYWNFHLSTWLLDNGYVTLMDPMDRDADFLQNVEWMGTQAYTLGINGIYLNLIGRESEGMVSPMQADKLLDEIIEKLYQIKDPVNGARVVQKVYKATEVYAERHRGEAPDLIVGYAPGYRGSWETALGKFPKGELLRPNTDAWSGDHCMASEAVPGVLFTNQPIKLKDPKLYDLPVTILEAFGLERPADMIGRNVLTGK
jgi:predicted AlkP superfamily phosphohydrolase/phosphomutase